MTKLAIFLPSLRGGGAERSMLKLAHGINALGHPVDLVLARAEGPYLDEVGAGAGAGASLRVIDLRASRVLRSVPGLARYLRRERPAALLSALDYANIVALWARRLAGVRLTSAVNEQNTLSVDARHTADWRGRMVPRLAKRFYPWATHIIGNSEGVADDLGQVLALPRQRIRVIYNPIITPDLAARAAAPADHPWLAPGQPPLVLAAGRLTAQKNYPLLIRAFAGLRRRSHLSARLLIIGEGPERARLEALIGELGLGRDVALPGFVDNPYAYMSRAALYVLSSDWEGLPTVLVEALYCGAPVVATDCPSGPREILRGGRFGRLVPVGDRPAMTAALAAALGAPRRPAPAVSWQPFDAAAVAGQYAGLLLRGRP